MENQYTPNHLRSKNKQYHEEKDKITPKLVIGILVGIGILVIHWIWILHKGH